jgi:hypothetical protein
MLVAEVDIHFAAMVLFALLAYKHLDTSSLRLFQGSTGCDHDR